MKPNFILIDDDRIGNALCHILIEMLLPQAGIQLFTNPTEAFEHIAAKGQDADPTILLLDIYMQESTGWDWLAQFETLPASTRNQYTVYIMSFSINPADREMASNHPLVKGFLEKPLVMEILKKVV